ncbi:MAG TPA: DNA repair protein RecO [candidate division Zixibacteria bacterium]|nr:DNA repair protein RecO [candidate division Zixibacteria bacterium]
MAIKATEAILLRAHNWSESSRTVVFFTRDYGRLALTDRGGRRLTGKRGRLVPFARLELTFYHSEKESAGYLSDVSLVQAWQFEREGTLGRLAFASAAIELLLSLLGDRAPHPDLYTYTVSYLELVETAPKQGLGPLFVNYYIRLISRLGYHPSLTRCVACGATGERLADAAGGVQFSAERGGMVCRACESVGDCYIPFSSESHRLIRALEGASLGQAATLPISYRETVRLTEALTRFLSFQADVRAELKALTFLEKLRKDAEA